MGDPVYAENHRSNAAWVPAKVIQVMGPISYEVSVHGRGTHLVLSHRPVVQNSAPKTGMIPIAVPPCQSLRRASQRMMTAVLRAKRMRSA